MLKVYLKHFSYCEYIYIYIYIYMCMSVCELCCAVCVLLCCMLCVVCLCVCERESEYKCTCSGARTYTRICKYKE
jgi:hypothetical protein